MANNTLSRVLWKISIPIIFVEATETFNHLIDTLFLARVGVTELGAIGVADSVLLLFLLLPLALVDGMQILTARRVGQRRPEGVGSAFNQGLLLVLADQGQVVLLAAKPEAMEELGQFQAIEGKTWNHPVIQRGRLFVRNGQEAAAFDLQ